MSTTLNEMIRRQILDEGPQIEAADVRERYIDSALNDMSNVELLERISDALEYAATRMAVRPRL
jgi:hypothetical protein